MSKEAITRAFGKAKLWAIRNKSDIFMVTGFILDLTGTAWLTKSVYDCHDDIEEHKVKVKKARTKKEKNKVTLNTAKKVAKKTVLPAAVKLTGDAFIVASKAVDKKTIGGLTASVSSLSMAYASARQRVAEAEGEDKAAEYFDGVKEKTVVDSEAGGVTKEYEVNEERGDYSAIFDSANSTGWIDNAYVNKKTIQDVERYANFKLRKNGYVFVNEIRKDLKLPLTATGYIAGWIYDPDFKGEKQIDFGLGRKENKRFMEGLETVAILYFNCEPNIMTKLNLQKY